ncbi:hypothetical protein DYB37_002727 [Aphanomyces astaci]|uniref:Uncharacterized protein n=1 Tax=Aphanomyces astaci TaxID=112090 RepID=A0A3R6XT31_APHAT|nr:hypothetical protein DYB35_000761 [Aphanomyces astaci]RHZ22232.1 hypothetical protein DYB37_002727 [Aphanomyces astaci]
MVLAWTLIVMVAMATAQQLGTVTPPSLRTIYVCSSSDASLNGVYQVDESLRSDDLPVFTRTDQDDDDLATHDYRLFRHQGYWAFANFASWPPDVMFRCDPYRNHHEDNVACEKGQAVPPLSGYTARQADTTLTAPPTLQLHPCALPLTISDL